MYSNSTKTDNHFRTQVTAISQVASAVPVLRPLFDHRYWSFFKQAEIIAGQPFSDQERKLFMGQARIKKLRKRQYLLQENDMCRYFGFILKGAVKTYSINERGQESILSFAMENDWVTDMESFLERKESNFHIEVLEDLELITLEKEHLFSLMSSIPAMKELLHQYQIKQLIESQKRINAALSMNAEERYYDLLANKPDYAQRFSQNALACYLGVKPETLSRIRKH